MRTLRLLAGRGCMACMEALATLSVRDGWWRLRAARESDVEAIAEHGRAGNDRWIGITEDSPPGRAEYIVAEMMRGWDGAFGLSRLVVTRMNDAVVGMICLLRHDTGRVELVYGVAPHWRNRGLATEVVRAVAPAVVEEGLAPRVELVIDPKNLASQRVAAKSGFVPDGHRRGVVEGTGQTFDDLVFVWPPGEAAG